MLLDPPFEAPPAPAPALEAAVAQQRRRRVRALRGGFGRNAGRAVKTGLGIHAGSCAERGRSASPASAETVAAFVDAMSETRSPATVRRRVAGTGARRKRHRAGSQSLFMLVFAEMAAARCRTPGNPSNLRTFPGMRESALGTPVIMP